jgi:hypothetical protein
VTWPTGSAAAPEKVVGTPVLSLFRTPGDGSCPGADQLIPDFGRTTGLGRVHGIRSLLELRALGAQICDLNVRLALLLGTESPPTVHGHVGAHFLGCGHRLGWECRRSALHQFADDAGVHGFNDGVRRAGRGRDLIEYHIGGHHDHQYRLGGRAGGEREHEHGELPVLRDSQAADWAEWGKGLAETRRPCRRKMVGVRLASEKHPNAFSRPSIGTSGSTGIEVISPMSDSVRKPITTRTRAARILKMRTTSSLCWTTE